MKKLEKKVSLSTAIDRGGWLDLARGMGGFDPGGDLRGSLTVGRRESLVGKIENYGEVGPKATALALRKKLGSDRVLKSFCF